MANAETRLIEEIRSLKRQRNLTFHPSTSRTLLRKIKALRAELREYRAYKEKSIEHKTISGIDDCDYIVVKRLYVKSGLGIDEIDAHFKGKYRHSQIRTAVLEVVKGGN